jgi:hypothetical protein
MTWGRKTGGREKGVRNRKVAQRRAQVDEAVAAGMSPLDYMLMVYRDPTADQSRRDEMAKAAAPYCHHRLSAIEHTGKGGDPLFGKMNADELREHLIREAKELGLGMPAPAPSNGAGKPH